MKNSLAIKKIKKSGRKAPIDTKIAKKLGISSASMAYYAKKGEFERIGHGLYKVRGTSIVNDFQWEDLVETSLRIKGGVVCLISALALYELTEEIPRVHWIAIPHETSHRANESTRIVRYRNINLGKTFFQIDDFKLPIFDRERTIVDSFRYLDKEVAIKALKFAVKKTGDEKLDLEKLRKYAKALRFKIEPYVLAVTT